MWTPSVSDVTNPRENQPRPYRHDEYERFIVAAYPYYASIFSTMGAFFLFGLSVLYTK